MRARAATHVLEGVQALLGVLSWPVYACQSVGRGLGWVQDMSQGRSQRSGDDDGALFCPIEIKDQARRKWLGHLEM